MHFLCFFNYILCIKPLFFRNFLIIFLILAFVDLFSTFLDSSSLSLLANVLSTEIPVAVHWSVVSVRGQRLAFTKRPRRFQLTAAVALAMCGWETEYLLHGISLTEYPCMGTVSQGQSTHHAHTHTLILPYFTPLTTFPVKSGIGMAVKLTFTWGKTRMKCQHDIPICCHGNPESDDKPGSRNTNTNAGKTKAL